MKDQIVKYFKAHREFLEEIDTALTNPQKTLLMPYLMQYSNGQSSFLHALGALVNVDVIQAVLTPEEIEKMEELTSTLESAAIFNKADGGDDDLN